MFGPAQVLGAHPAAPPAYDGPRAGAVAMTVAAPDAKGARQVAAWRWVERTPKPEMLAAFVAVGWRRLSDTRFGVWQMEVFQRVAASEAAAAAA